MRHFLVKSSSFAGSVFIPPSKSQTMRAILFAALASGKSEVQNYLPAPDTDFIIEACRLMGATIKKDPHTLEIHGVDGKISSFENVIQAGNSGIILRFMAAIGALSPSYTIITGDHSLRHLRPMSLMLHAFRQLGVFAVSSRDEGYAPLIIKGPLKGGKVTIPGEDSQPVSSLLIALSLAQGPSELNVTDPGEKPWVLVTLDWFDRLAIPYKNENFEKYTLPGGARFHGFKYTVPGDWSSSAFAIGAALVTKSSLTIENLSMDDPQGDKKIIDALIEMGAKIAIENNKLHIFPSQLKGITIDVNPFIDAITILAVIACFAEGETHLIHAKVARTKECDRLQCITEELTKMGASILALEDSLIIKGAPLHGATVHSHGDHRMAMSLAIAAFGAEGSSEVQDVDCVKKTFPHFAETFQKIGGSILS